MSSYSNGFKDGGDGEDVLKVRGLPWSTTVDEVVDFFKDVIDIPNGKDGVHMILSRDGRPSGEAYVEVSGQEEIEKGLTKHNENMGHRYIEVFKAQKSELEWMMKRGGVVSKTDSEEDSGCVRLRGLPFECSKEEIAQFFSGLQIVPNGITILTDFQGRNTGEAYVEFANKDMADEALSKHKEKIGHRYIEVFRSSASEVHAAQSNMRMRGGDSMPFGRPGPYDRFGPGSRGFGGPPGRGSGFRRNRPYNDYGDYGPAPGGPRGGPGWGPGPMRVRFGGGTGHRVHMRGLPFRANEQDIADFFRPMNPVNIKVIYERNGRASGEADVDFATHDEAMRAMKKDKNTMQHRYIELFLDSTVSGGMGGPGPMGGYGGGGGGGRW